MAGIFVREKRKLTGRRIRIFSKRIFCFRQLKINKNMNIGPRWLSSAAMYLSAEYLAAHLQDKPPDKQRVARVTVAGATGDAVCLRAFHGVVDRRLPNPLLRTLAEQTLYAPWSTAGYLTVVRTNTQWTWDDFWMLYQRDMAFWGCTSFLGYRYVPRTSRFLYISTASAVFNTWRAMLCSS